MPHNRTPTSAANETIAGLAQPRLAKSLDPIAGRFVYSLRLIALHQKRHADPVPELASRLKSISVAAQALALSQTVASVWPENVQVSRFCCCKLTPDEATIADMISSAFHRDRHAFEHTIEGLIRPDRKARLWESVLSLVEAELSAL